MKKKIIVIRREADFDRACDNAASQASDVEKDTGDDFYDSYAWEEIRIKFVSYELTMSYSEREHVYTFEAEFK